MYLVTLTNRYSETIILIINSNKIEREKMALFKLFILLFLIVLSALSKSPEEWKSRTIYQLLTDRFARTNGSDTPCLDWKNYCGGTFQGIINNLDYIQGMGFDAIWISPVVSNIDRGYHGYWTKNLYEINSYFGTEQDLKNLIDACHERDIWVMVDVVANHMAPIEQDFEQLYPFNDASYFHDDCTITDFNDQNQVLYCWLFGLADLAQENPKTRNLILDWVKNLVNDYNIDGLRVDTVPYVPKDFWYEFTQAAGVYCLGEANLGSFENIASFQGPVQGLVNYPLFWVLRPIFQFGSSMVKINYHMTEAKNVWRDMELLGTFMGCHDTFRFLADSGNIPGYRAAMAFILTTTGIPIVYQGEEQYFSGGDDPANREPLWTAMNSESDMYKYIQRVVSIRKENKIWRYEQKELDFDDKYYSFMRGSLYFCFTNAQDYQERWIYSHPYPEGTTVCNLMIPDHKDCLSITGGLLKVILINGEVKIWVPRTIEEDKSNIIVMLKTQLASLMDVRQASGF